MTDTAARQECLRLDREDQLSAFRDHFVLPDDVIYLDGNSLGPPTRATAERLLSFVRDEWGAHLIGGWEHDGWISLGARLGDRIAPLIGAGTGEVMVADSTTVNLYKLIHAAADARPDRNVVLISGDDFPTDRYLVHEVAHQRGMQVRHADPAAWHGAALADVAVAVLSHVHFRTGALHDMAKITTAVRRAGGLMLWDLSHSAGALPIDVHADGVELAVGCTYKFMCGGPGAPAFAMVAHSLQAELRTPMPGWLGHAAPFAFADNYEPADGVGWLVTGTPAVASFVALDAALDVIVDVDMRAARAKAARLGQIFLSVIERDLPDVFTLHSPQDPQQRGNHVSLGHPDGYAIVQALIANGVVGDFREPDVLRFGFAPLYVRYVDAFDAASALVQVMRTDQWRDPAFAQRGMVT